MKDKKVIFNPIGRCGTDVTFLHTDIRVPCNHVSQHINQTKDFINQLHQHVEGAIFQALTRNTLECMRALIQYARIHMEEIHQKLPKQDATEALTDTLERFKRFLDPIYIAIGVSSSILKWVFDFFQAQEVKILWQDPTWIQDNIRLPEDLVCYQRQTSGDTSQPHGVHQEEHRGMDGSLQCQPGLLLHQDPTDVLPLPG